MKFVRWWREVLADAFAGWAARRREVDARYRAEWEAETEPGYKMGGLAEAGSDITRAWADLQDSLADAIRPR